MKKPQDFYEDLDYITGQFAKGDPDDNGSCCVEGMQEWYYEHHENVVEIERRLKENDDHDFKIAHYILDILLDRDECKRRLAKAIDIGGKIFEEVPQDVDQSDAYKLLNELNRINPHS